jgi:hypothetical protein
LDSLIQNKTYAESDGDDADSWAINLNCLNGHIRLEGDEVDGIDHFRMAAQGLHGIELSGIGFKNKRKVCLQSAFLICWAISFQAESAGKNRWIGSFEMFTFAGISRSSIATSFAHLSNSVPASTMVAG